MLLINAISPNENISGLKSTKIKNISHVHLPTPLIEISFSKTSSLLEFSNLWLFFSKKINELLKMGIDISNIVVDPGIGFGKNKYHNLDILKNISIFHGLGVPILLGVSRKALIGQLTIDDFLFRGVKTRSINPSKRLSGSLVFAMHAFNNGIQIIRTHDVFETKQALTCQFSLN